MRGCKIIGLTLFFVLSITGCGPPPAVVASRLVNGLVNIAEIDSGETETLARSFHADEDGDGYDDDTGEPVPDDTDSGTDATSITASISEFPDELACSDGSYTLFTGTFSYTGEVSASDGTVTVGVSSSLYTQGPGTRKQTATSTVPSLECTGTFIFDYTDGKAAGVGRIKKCSDDFVCKVNGKIISCEDIKAVISQNPCP